MAAEARPSSFVSLLLGWTQQGVDSVLATQRILLDFAARKNASMMKSLREGVSDKENSPASILTELAVEATANFTEAQRILLNVAQEENGLLMTGIKDHMDRFPAAVALADRLSRAFDAFVEMQQEVLTIVSKQAQQRLKPKAGKTAEGSHLIDGAREAMDSFVRAQKKFLDIALHEPGKTKGRDDKKKTELSKLARESADCFIEAQKKLLDLAGQQVNVNLQAASRAVTMAKSFRPPLPVPFPNLTTERVKSFVDAEKALIDSVMKPGHSVKVTVKPPVAHKRPARRRETKAAAQPAQAGM